MRKNEQRVTVYGMANGHRLDYDFTVKSEAVALVVSALREPAPRQRIAVSASTDPTRLERIRTGARYVVGAMRLGRNDLARYGARIIRNALKIGDKMNTPTYVDADTLAIAREVAAAEGISLAEALRDQLELFG